MKLHNQFLILLGGFLFLFLTIGASVYYTSEQINHLGQQEKTAQEIVKGAYQLAYLSNDYLIHTGEVRPNIQWDQKYKELILENNPDR